ncbi:MAG: histidine phosphatase family protein [Acidiferrobacterales bacterium]
MKLLFLVRHAKASWKDANLPDRGRPLNKRGERDAPRMGMRLAQRTDRPELIVSSPAGRALTTAQVFATELGYEPADVTVDEDIYAAGPRELIEVIRGFDDQYQQIMLVGHNPALTDLVNQLAGSDIENMPTCGVAVLRFETDTWATVETGTAKLLEFDYPKKLAD